jgi:Fur family ferric uptake transcriptional regulator
MLERLSAAGYKVTGPRRRVLAALHEARQPCTAQEVAELAGTTPASTYRALALLVALGVVSEVADGPAEAGCGAESRCRRYALCSADGHHHHFVCRSCHATLEVTSEALERALAELERSTGLHVEEHDVMLRGQCLQCQGASTP